MRVGPRYPCTMLGCLASSLAAVPQGKDKPIYAPCCVHASMHHPPPFTPCLPTSPTSALHPCHASAWSSGGQAVLGRVASRLSVVLQGKDKPIYSLCCLHASIIYPPPFNPSRPSPLLPTPSHAVVLQGKDKPIYSPSIDKGDVCIVVNADKIAVTGDKMKQKTYRWHTGYIGGLKERTLKDQMAKDPKEVIRKAVLRMLPRNRLVDPRMTKLRIFEEGSHPFEDIPAREEAKPAQLPHLLPPPRTVLIFMDVVSQGVSGLLESHVLDDDMSSTATSHSSTRSAERARRRGLRRRRYQLLLEDLQGMGDGELRDMYRIKRAILDYVVDGMKYYMQPYVDRYFITHEVANLVPIKYLASAPSYMDLSHLFGLSKTLCHELVDVWLMQFCSVFRQQWVHFPTCDDLDEMAEEFRAVKGVPAVVGAIDGTHVHMKGMEGHRQEYWTRKSAYAVQLQVTCDARNIIWDFLIGYPGNAHDQRVFMDSASMRRGPTCHGTGILGGPAAQ
ncbi:unnamed protein product [Closterium sp. Naga37s-1]|nr:unnamed protein product [Closterium sp. Naga37s-1]